MVVAGGCSDERSDERQDEHSDKRKPWEHNFAVFINGKKTGYGHAYFRIEDGKAVSGIEINNPWLRDVQGGMAAESVRCVETMGGKPLSFRSKATTRDGDVIESAYTVDDNGKVRITAPVKPGSDPSTRPSAKVKTADYPEDAVLFHGEHLLIVKHGLKEGTEFSYKRFFSADREPIVVSVRVGPTEMEDLLGQKKLLTQITFVQKDPSGDLPANETVCYLDGDLVPCKVRSKWNDTETTWISCSREEARRAP